MAKRLTEAEVARFLREVEEGRVVLTPEVEPQGIYAGNVEYRASNGWRVVVFNDCNEWDYIDALVAADGRSADFDEIEGWPSLANYTPSDDVAWSRYRIPGYLQFRCIACGRVLSHRRNGDFQCGDCLAGRAAESGVAGR